ERLETCRRPQHIADGVELDDEDALGDRIVEAAVVALHAVRFVWRAGKADAVVAAVRVHQRHATCVLASGSGSLRAVSPMVDCSTPLSRLPISVQLKWAAACAQALAAIRSAF